MSLFIFSMSNPLLGESTGNLSYFLAVPEDQIHVEVSWGFLKWVPLKSSV